MLTLNLRRWVLDRDESGHTIWRQQSTPRRVPASRTAIIVCDMWDDHWSRGAAERVNAMVARMDHVLHTAREQGITIVHAPSETMDFYAGTPARGRILEAPAVDPPPEEDRPDPPLPIDDSDGGSDTGEPDWHRAWRRQHPGLNIDQTRDCISDNGREIYSFLQQSRIEQVLIMGVHTNMCVLRRSFAIKQMVKWGVAIALVRDLTDAMYNPAKPPYVSHEAGTQLVIGYIERFWCPSVHSEEIGAS